MEQAIHHLLFTHVMWGCFSNVYKSKFGGSRRRNGQTLHGQATLAWRDLWRTLSAIDRVEHSNVHLKRMVAKNKNMKEMIQPSLIQIMRAKYVEHFTLVTAPLGSRNACGMSCWSTQRGATCNAIVVVPRVVLLTPMLLPWFR